MIMKNVKRETVKNVNFFFFIEMKHINQHDGMAKLGEGDQRWIVDDRSDGKNVGAWHWEEKDLTSSTHDAIKNAFDNVGVEGPLSQDLSFKEVSEISGDVTVAQRKGKIFCYFDIKMAIKFKGKVDGTKVEGKCQIPEIDHDTVFDDDYAINVTTTSSDDAANRAASVVKNSGRDQIRKIISALFKTIFQDNNVGKTINKAPGSTTQLTPGTKADHAGPPPTPTIVTTPQPTPKPTQSATSSKTSSEPKSDRLEWSMRWFVPQEELWVNLTSPERASVYTRAPTKIQCEPSGAFEYLGGLISGYFVDIKHPEKLSMQWRLNSWPSGVFSTVVITLEKEEPGVTKMEFAQLGIPEGEKSRVKDGWVGNFWNPIKGMFGYRLDYL